MKNFWRLVLVNALLLMALLATTEVVCRIVLAQIYNRSFDSSLIQDNKYGSSSGLRPNTSGMVWGYLMHTDTFGARRNNIAYKAGAKKWLHIGDSVAEGVGVADSSTFSALAANVFSEFNVLNFSLIGYSTADYTNVLTSLVPNDTSVELVTLFYCLNDVYGHTPAANLPSIARPDWLGNINALLQNRYATYKLIKLLFYQHSNKYFTYDLQFYQKDNPYFVQSMKYLYQCDSVCKSNGKFFQVVMLPYRSQLQGDLNTGSKPQQLVGQFCNAAGISFSDASQYLAHQKDVNSLYLFADEIHFSEKGHNAIARFLSE